MPISFKDSFKGGAEKVCKSRVYGFVKNPIVVALILTIIILVIISCINKEKSSRWEYYGKVGFWTLLVVSLFLFLHYYAVTKSLTEASEAEGIREVFTSISSNNSGYSIKPRSSSSIIKQEYQPSAPEEEEPPAAQTFEKEEPYIQEANSPQVETPSVEEYLAKQEENTPPPRQEEHRPPPEIGGFLSAQKEQQKPKAVTFAQ